MTLRTIQWIADSGLLVGLTTIGAFTSSPALAELSLSLLQYTLGVPTSGAILGATAGSVITGDSLPAGLMIGAAGWAYDGTGVAGTYPVFLTETLFGSANSPLITSMTVSIAATGAALDFSQSANSGEVAAIRSF